METATQHGNAVPIPLRGILGDRWTPQQLQQLDEAFRGLVEARKRLGYIARRENGVKGANLFASNDRPSACKHW